MTIQSAYEITEYATNGVGPYLFDWAVSSDSFVVVAIDGTVLTEDVDFSVSFNTPADGGSVTLFVGPIAGLKLQIGRRTIQSQTLDLQAYTRFPSEANEAALDKLTLISQEQEARINGLAEVLNQPVYSNVTGGVFVTTSG